MIYEYQDKRKILSVLTKDSIKQKLKNDPEVQKRIAILKLATKINPEFKNPTIIGGFLRDTIFELPPNDCDVVFDGYMKDQPEILECVREAEKRLGFEHYDNWEFENFNVSGVTGNMVEDCIGFYSQHTNYLTLLLLGAKGKLSIGSDKTLENLETKTFEIRYQGFSVWLGLKNQTYFKKMAEVACHGLYLCHKLQLNIHPSAEDLFNHFETNFSKIKEEEKNSLVNYWKKKTEKLSNIQQILDRFEIKSLS